MSAMRREEPARIYHALWSAEDDDVLREAYGRVPTKDLAVRFGRSVKAVYDRARTLDLAQPARRSEWTAEETRLLRELYGRVSRAELAARLGRTRPSVANRAGTLGLTRATHVPGSLARDLEEIKRLRAENDHLKRGALDAAHAPTADARRLAVLMAYRLLVIDAATAAVVLGVPEKRLAIEIGKAAKLGLDITRDVLEDR